MSAETEENAAKLPDLPKKDYTLEELKQYNGANSNGRILLALLGNVFDVSSAPKFYGPGGSYASLAGRDATRALALFKMDENTLKDSYDDTNDLTETQLKHVKQWEERFLSKYQIVGKLLKPGEEPTDYTKQ